MEKIEIVIADDHEIVRRGIRELINAQPDMRVIGEAADGRGVFDMVKVHNPDAVLMDITMPHTDGIWAAQRITSRYPDVKVLALSVHNESSFVVRMLKAGASAYLLKEGASEEVVDAVHRVVGGHIYISIPLMKKISGEFSAYLESMGEGGAKVLSEKEQTVLNLLSKGFPVEEIGGRTGLASDLVISIIGQILNKWLLLEKMH